MGVFTELDFQDPVPALNAPVISYELQQCFLGGAQVCVAPRGAPCEPLQMSGKEGLPSRVPVAANSIVHLVLLQA